MDPTPAIVEGFLCPICRRDLGSFHQLHSHFEAEHSPAEKQLMGQIKGLFGNVKKVLNVPVAAVLNPFENESVDSDSGSSYVPARNTLLTAAQPLGNTTDHTASFKTIRSKRLNQFVIQSNSMVIRLQKLVDFSSTDPRARRDFEKQLVPWIDDSQVHLCPGCGRKFLPAVRPKHHCRLCGAVQCEECSCNLDMESARKVLRDIFRDTDNNSIHSGDESDRRSSVASTIDNGGNVILVRMCRPCWQLVERRARAKHRSTRDALDSALQEKYTALRSEIESADDMFRKYETMAVALRAADETIDIDEANRLRARLCATFEHIDAASKAVLVQTPSKSTASDDLTSSEPPHASEAPVLTRNIILRRKIRQQCVEFLQRRSVLVMTPLPTHEDLMALKAQREEERKRRWKLESEKRADLDNQRQSSKNTRKSNESTNGSVKTTKLRAKPSGFMPEPLNPFAIDDEIDADPLSQQMAQVREYLQQARTAGKHDEVRILEENLRELSEAFQQQQLACSVDSSSSTSTAPRDPGEHAA